MTRTPKLRPLALLLVFLLAAPALAVDSGLLDLAPPDANFVIGLRVADVLRSPLVSGLLDDARAENPELGLFLGGPGEQPLPGLEEVLIVGRAEAEGEQSAQDDSLAILRGDFSASGWLEGLCSQGCESTQYQGFEIRSAQAGGTPADVVVLDGRYAAVGAPERVRQAIDRRRRGVRSPFADAVQQWADGLGRRPIWLAATGPFDVPEESMGGMQIGGMDQINGLGLGLDLGEDLDLALELRTRDEAGARQLYDAAQGLLALLSLSAQGEASEAGGENPQAEIAELLENLQLTQKARSLHASLRVPAAKIREQIEAGIASAVEGGGEISVAGADPVTRPAQPDPAPPAREGVIRIYGMEEEVVEVPVNPR